MQLEPQEYGSQNVGGHKRLQTCFWGRRLYGPLRFCTFLLLLVVDDALGWGGGGGGGNSAVTNASDAAAFLE